MPGGFEQPMAESSPLPSALASLLGPAGLLTEPTDLAPALADWRSLYQGRALALLRPANTAELAEAVRLCAGAGIAIVPQGGNTSMVGGATPDASGRAVIVSLARMNRIRDLDPLDMTMTANGIETGTIRNFDVIVRLASTLATEETILDIVDNDITHHQSIHEKVARIDTPTVTL